LAKRKTINPSIKTQNLSVIEQFIEQRAYQIFALLSIVGLFIIFKDYLLFDRILMYTDIASDSYTGQYTKFYHNAMSLRETGIPKWSFYHGMGQNLFPGHINNPFWLILYALGENLEYGLVYVEILKMFLTGTIFFFFLKARSHQAFTCIVGALLITFCGGLMLQSSGWYELSSFFILSVFLLFSFEMLFTKGKWVWLPIAVALISYNLYYFYLSAVFLLPYSILRAYELEYSIKIYTRKIIYVGLLSILGMGINALFIIANFNLMINSPRAIGDASHTDKLSAIPIFSLESTHFYKTMLLRFFSNDMLGTGKAQIINNINHEDFKGWGNYLEAPIFYCGLICLILLPQVFIKNSKRNIILYGSFLILWTLFLIFPYFRYALYFFKGDYLRFGLVFIIPVTLMIYTCIAIDKLLKKNKLNLISLGATLLALLVFLLIDYKNLNHSIVYDKVKNLVIVFLILHSVSLLFLHNKTYQNISKILFLITICFELIVMGNITINERSYVKTRIWEKKLGYNDYSLDAVNYLKSKDSSFFRINKSYESKLNPNMHSSLNDAKAQLFFGSSVYYSFNQINYITFLQEAKIIPKGDATWSRWAPGVKNRPLLQIITNHKYNIFKHKCTGTEQFYLDSVNSFDNNTLIYKNKINLPFGYTYDKISSLDTYNKFKNSYTREKDILMLLSCIIDNEDIKQFNTLNTKDVYNYIDTIGIVKDTAYIVPFTKNNQELMQFFPTIKKLCSKYNLPLVDSTGNLAYNKTSAPKGSSYYFMKMLLWNNIKNAVLQRKEDTLSITEWSQNHFKGTVELDKPKIMFFSIPFDKGWKATSNGKEIQLFKANIGFTGMLLAEGKHEILLKFSPPYLKLSIIISSISIIIFIFVKLFISRLKLNYL